MDDAKNDANGITSLAGGDPEQVRRIRANLATVARRTDDPELAGLMRDVLDGRADVRQAVGSPAFQRVAAPRFANLEAGLDRLPENQRTRLLDAAAAGELPRTDPDLLDGLRDGTVSAPSTDNAPTGPATSQSGTARDGSPGA